MKRNIKYFLLLLILFAINWNFIIGQKSELPILKCKNEKVNFILDSLFNHEKNMAYYDSDIDYYIDLQKKDTSIIMSIGSFHNIIKTGSEKGIYQYCEDTVIVSGFIEPLFEIQNETISYNFYEPQVHEISDSSEVLIDIYEDDSYTYWNFLITNGRIYKIKAHTPNMP